MAKKAFNKSWDEKRRKLKQEKKELKEKRAKKAEGIKKLQQRNIELGKPGTNLIGH